MYIDTLEKGKNPLSLFMTANDADYGKLGQAASQYLNDPEYRTLRKDADFIAAIAALHHADENVMKAELCIGITDDSRKRVFVERRSTPRSYDDLWTNEAIFLNYLAKAQVELTEAVRRLETAAKSPEGTRIGINRTLVASTRENLEKFNAAIERIDANALFKVEELAENIKPEPASAKAASITPPQTISAEGFIDPSRLAAAQYLEQKFPGLKPDDALAISDEIVKLSQGTNQGQSI